MKIAVFGATGNTGRAFVEQALAKGHEVTAFVRNADALALRHERAGVTRLMMVSAVGVGETRHQAPILPRIMYRLLLTDIFADKQAGEDAIRASARA